MIKTHLKILKKKTEILFKNLLKNKFLNKIAKKRDIMNNNYCVACHAKANNESEMNHGWSVCQ